MNPIRRFAAVGSVATVLDVVLLVVLAQVVGWPVAGADAVAIIVATAVSATGHLRFTVGADPSTRWFRDAPRYLATAAAALAIDVVVLVLLTGNGPVSTLHLLAAKAVSLTAAFLLRSFFFRRTMFAAVRSRPGRRRAIGPAPGAVRLSLVIPAYCEEDGIAATLERVERELGHAARRRRVRDRRRRRRVARRAPPTRHATRGADRVIRLDPNRGKGGAVRAGVLEATGRTIAFTDADLSYSPSQVLLLLAEVERGWDVVVGSRRHTDARALVAARRLREVGGRVVNMLTWLVLLGQYRDTQCGLKAFRSDVARMIFSVTRDRRLRLRRRGVPPGRAVPVRPPRGAGRGRQQQPLDGARRPRHVAAGPRPVPHPSGRARRGLRDLGRGRAADPRRTAPRPRRRRHPVPTAVPGDDPTDR